MSFEGTATQAMLANMPVVRCCQCFGILSIGQTECECGGLLQASLVIQPHSHPDNWHAVYGDPGLQPLPTPTLDVEDIVRDLQGEHGISWTHAAAFIKLVEGCGCCSERLRMVLDRLFEIGEKGDKP